ncbi:hypothetical protein CORC01_03220 [Colletotrichum orchidophilum]|uniref:Uncharacterized protein n=1 Tax=Colletotrichum orchidophilum TaxID=1209926 RepID=A0A1G4BJ73_9PEZI|nr:uncharacterized protein CORC01_03220 [Colletotrichum orchidophilum]OHF01464.1 hypothetical protein CORC01_03220 [Colletotrichum orchidophilum]
MTSGHMRPDFSRLMSKLEEIFAANVRYWEAAKEISDSLEPYMINSADLLNIINALTAVDISGFPIYGGRAGNYWAELAGKNLMSCPDRHRLRPPRTWYLCDTASGRHGKEQANSPLGRRRYAQSAATAGTTAGRGVEGRL